jgi:hypothetical protein
MNADYDSRYSENVKHLLKESVLNCKNEHSDYINIYWDFGLMVMIIEPLEMEI